jgi:cell division septation protein DedD
MLASDPESRFGMQLEKAHPTCPLCKRQSTPTPTGALINTRLCKSCRTVVASAFRGTTTYRTPQNLIIPEPAISINQANLTLQEVDEVESVSNMFIEDSALPLPSFELETKPPLLFDEPHDRKFEFYEKDDSLISNPPTASTFQVSENGSANGSSKLHREFSNPLARPTLLVERQPETQFIQAETPALAETPVTLSPAPADLAAPQPTVVSEPVDAPVLNVGDYESSTDPWAAPLPAWDYSQSEWPVLVAEGKRKSAIPYRTAIAAVFLLFVVGFLYFMFNGLSTPDRPADVTTAARASAGGESRSAMTPVSADTRKDNPTPETKPTSSQPPEQAPHDAAAATDKGAAGGHFSLQAASFPTERDADIFADRLKQAGVPSYVVPADVSHRGRWYRVRVGRFNAAEDAQRFAGEAQQRARAAGLAVQLVVCQYDQP